MGEETRGAREELEAARAAISQRRHENAALRARLGGADAGQAPEEASAGEPGGVYRRPDPGAALEAALEAANDELARLMIEKSVLEGRLGRAGARRPDDQGLRAILKAGAGGLLGAGLGALLVPGASMALAGAVLGAATATALHFSGRIPPRPGDPEGGLPPGASERG